MPLKIENLFQVPAGPTDRESIRQLVDAGRVQIEQIASHGQPSPEGFWYDQPTAEWVVLLKGSATLAIDGEGKVDLAGGDFLLIPAHLRHRVERTSSDALWLAVHFTEDR